MGYDPKGFEWWQARLDGTALDIYNDTPMTGYYAYLPGGKKEKPKAVIFFYSQKDGSVVCKIDGQPVKYGLDIWPACAKNPIPYDVYKTVVDGGLWPSEIKIETAHGTDSTRSSSPKAGDNAADDFMVLKGNIEEWGDRARKAIKKGAPTTQEEANSVADIATKLSDLLNEAEERRDRETKPLFQAYKIKNEAFTSFMTPAKPLVTNLKSLGHIFIKAENARREAAAREANEAAAAAAAEEAAKNAPQGAAEEHRDPPQVMPVVVAEPVRIGTRKTVTTVKRDVVVFDDFAKAAAYFCSQTTVADHIRDAIEKSAFQALKAGLPIPGARMEKKEGAR